MFSNHQQLVSCLNNSLRSARLQHFRVMLVLAGEANLHLKSVNTIRDAFIKVVNDETTQSPLAQSVTLSPDYIMHVPNPHSNSDVSDEINSLLGDEHACVIFDARTEFDERLFTAAAGTITAGGLLVLQTPALHKWPTQQHNRRGEDSQSLFISRLCEKLAAHCSLSVNTTPDTQDQVNAPANKPLFSAFFIAATPETDITDRNTCDTTHYEAWKIEQDSMLESLLQHLLTKTQSVSVIQGDRGRGKSTLIGRAMKRLMEAKPNNQRSISITANRRSACTIVLTHAKQTIPFFPIDKALSTTHDILIVEEAGSIPIPVLEQLMNKSQSVVFATTVQGYEGAGRGFAIRFAKKLDKLKPGWLNLNPNLPIRWSAGDPLEAFVNDAFLLKTKLPSVAKSTKLSPNESQVNLITRHTLANDDSLLTEVYGLLVQAHYQTTPADLRNLLDQPRLLLFVQKTSQVLTGAALVALEGDISGEWHQPIMNKQRRLADQLLPQLLAQSSGETDVLQQRFARIVRIAIHPAFHQQGFGTQLFKQLHNQLTSNSAHFTCVESIGASFGADQPTLSFWLKQGLKPVHYGYKANPRSALRAACLLSSTHLPTKQSIDKACHILRLNTQSLLSQAANDDPILELLVKVTKSVEGGHLSAHDTKRLIHDYCQSRRGFIDSVGLLLTSELFNENDSVLRAVHHTLKGYQHMPPKTRQIAEAQLRTVLLATGAFAEFH